jgi:hypothetical protein
MIFMLAPLVIALTGKGELWSRTYHMSEIDDLEDLIEVAASKTFGTLNR